MKTKSNIGELGVGSIRIAGLTPSDLPIAEGAITRPQLVVSIETERQNRIDNVRARFPAQTQDYLLSRIREAKNNLKLFAAQKAEVDAKRNEYSGLLSLCKHRDKEIELLDRESQDYDSKVRELKTRFGPWIVEAMEAQIGQFGDSMDRFDLAIAKEHESIAELRECLTLCRERDGRLKSLGVSTG